MKPVKVADLKTTMVAVPSKSLVSNLSLEGGVWRVAVIVEVLTSDGLIGLGEVRPPFPDMDFEGSKRIVDSAKAMLVGEDVFNVEPIKKKLYAAYNCTHFHIHAANWALNGIEMALWDLVGKKCGKPLYKIWGGAFRKKIPYVGSLPRITPTEKIAEKAVELVNRGFKTLSLKIGLDVEEDIERVKAMRESVGYNSNINIRVDANQSWSPGQAIQIINRLEKYGIEFVEQPVLMYDLEGLARVRMGVNVPVASHESSWTFYEVLNVIKKGAADVIHIDPRWDAGFTGARIGAGIAEAAGLPVLTHSFRYLGITECAYMHLIASCPNFILANQSGSDGIIDDVIMGGRLEFKDGCLDLPEKPGIGVELDPQRMEKYHAAYEENVKDKEPPREVPPYRFMSYRNYFK